MRALKMRIPKWQKGLTHDEQKHLRNTAGITARKNIERVFELQDDAVTEGRIDKCLDCKHIEIKLKEQGII